MKKHVFILIYTQSHYHISMFNEQPNLCKSKNNIIFYLQNMTFFLICVIKTLKQVHENLQGSDCATEQGASTSKNGDQIIN